MKSASAVPQVLAHRAKALRSPHLPGPGPPRCRCQECILSNTVSSHEGVTRPAEQLSHVTIQIQRKEWRFWSRAARSVEPEVGGTWRGPASQPNSVSFGVRKDSSPFPPPSPYFWLLLWLFCIKKAIPRRQKTGDKETEAEAGEGAFQFLLLSFLTQGPGWRMMGPTKKWPVREHEQIIWYDAQKRLAHSRCLTNGSS